MKPLIASVIFAILMMFLSVINNNKRIASNIALILFIALLGINIWHFTSFIGESSADIASLYNGMLTYNAYSGLFNVLMSLIMVIYIGLMTKYIERVGNFVAEYYALLFFIMAGMNLVTSYGNLLILFLGIEIMSIPQYILAGSDKRNLKSSEAALKYFLMGAFSTGILLMGIALMYGASGTFNVNDMNFTNMQDFMPLSIIGLILIIVALGFKVSAAPMHFWTPDVYDGAPTPFTAFLATIVKVGFFIGFIRLFLVGGILDLQAHSSIVLTVVATMTLLIGNITAVYQQSVKRMLAYSSIAQAGFMILAVLAINASALKGIMFYGVAYSIATIGMFAVLLKLKDFTYDGFNGLAKKNPFLAFSATIFLLSLAGIPLTAGFFAKYFILSSLLENSNQYAWLVIFALIMAAVSVFYYFKVIIAMYFKPATDIQVEAISNKDKFLLGITILMVIILGVYPDLIFNLLTK